MVEQNYEERLERLYSNLNHKLEIYREGKRHWDPFLSTDFNVVSKFIDPDENRLSDIIKYLLDANGSHGQGSKFLDAFLKRLFKENQPNPELSRNQIQVNREVPTYYNDENQRRRIDITIDFKNFIIGIENKPWAGEGDGQLEAYYKHLKCKCEREDKKFCLVFITPNRRKPTSIDNSGDLIGKGELCLLSYSSDILDWIEECGQLCESDRFRWFLHDFRDYIRDEFPPPFTIKANEETDKWTMRMSEKDIIIEYARKNIDNLEMVLDIISTEDKIEEAASKIEENEQNQKVMRDIIRSAGHELRERITNNFLDEFQVFIQGALEERWDVQGQRNLDMTSESLPKVRICLTVDFIGINVDPFDKPTQNLLKSKLDKEVKKGSEHCYWFWKDENWKYKYLDKDTLIKMHTETDRVVKEIGDRFLEIVRVAKPVIDKWIEENPLDS